MMTPADPEPPQERHLPDLARLKKSGLPIVEIYPDGSCANHRYDRLHVGGWAVVMFHPESEETWELSGCEDSTSAERMELYSIIMAFEILTKPSYVIVSSDCQYIVRAFTDGYLYGWQKNGWKNSRKRTVTNADLWRRLCHAIKPHEVKWLWIEGHTGHPQNERADQLAVSRRKQRQAQLNPPPAPSRAPS